jgi:nicotinamidase-related amidase
MSYCLAVVDMQHDFVASRKPGLAGKIAKLVKKAMQDDAVVILLEYVGYGPTKPTIKKALGNYKKGYVVCKEDDDGSNEIAKVLKHRENKCFGTPSSYVRLCGVNLGACVEATAGGLSERDIPVTLIEDACNQPQSSIGFFGGWDWESSVNTIANNPNTVVVHSSDILK